MSRNTLRTGDIDPVWNPRCSAVGLQRRYKAYRLFDSGRPQKSRLTLH